MCCQCKMQRYYESDDSRRLSTRTHITTAKDVLHHTKEQQTNTRKDESSTFFTLKKIRIYKKRFITTFSPFFETSPTKISS